MSLTDGRRWSQMHELQSARVLRARATLGKQVMARTCVVRHSALSSKHLKKVLITQQIQNKAPMDKKGFALRVFENLLAY